MADHYAVAGALSDWEWSLSGSFPCWATASGGTTYLNPPTSAEKAVLDAGTGEQYNANDLEYAGQFCRSLDMHGFIGTFTPIYEIDIGGDASDTSYLQGTIYGSALNVATSVTLLAGVVFGEFEPTLILDGISGVAAITCDGNELPATLVVGRAKAADAMFAFDFTVDFSGEYSDEGFAHTVRHNVVLVGDVTSAGSWTQLQSGYVRIQATAAVARLRVAVAADHWTCFDGEVYCRAFEHGAGEFYQSETASLFVTPDADEFWTSGTGPVRLAAVHIVLPADRSQAGAILLSNVTTLVVRHGASDPGDFTLTAGTIDAAAAVLRVYAPSAGRNITLAVTGNLTCGSVDLGDSAGCGTGKIAFGSGTHQIGGLKKYAADGPAGSACDLGSATITLEAGAVMDGSGITFRNTSGHVRRGTVQNVVVQKGDPALDAYTATDGGGNSNVSFEPADIPARMLMGVGR